NVDPGLRNRHDDIGLAEAKLVDQQHTFVGIGNGIANQVLAGYAEMHRAARELRGDLAGGEIGDLDIVEAHDGAAIFAGAPRYCDPKAGASEKRFLIFLQPSLGRNGQNEGRAHGLLPPGRRAGLMLVSASTQTEKPTAGIGAAAPSRVISPS